MHVEQADAFSKAILERALTHYANAEGDLGPTDPLDIAGVKAVAAELDVPDAYVDEALASPIVHAPTLANGFTITVEQFIGADPSAIMRSARPVLLRDYQHQVVAPTPQGATFKPIDGLPQSRDPYHLSGLSDLTLTCIPLGRQVLRAAHPHRTNPGNDDTGTIVQANGHIENPLANMLGAAVGMGLGFGHVPGVVLYHFTSLGNDISRNVAFIGIVLASVFGAWLAFRLWKQQVTRLTLQLVGALDRIKTDLAANTQTVVTVNQEALHIPLGSLITRMIRHFRKGHQSGNRR